MNTQLQTSKILLVDDHVLFREGAARLLAAERDFEVSAQCGSVQEALAILACTQVDVVLLDLDLGKARGLEFILPARQLGFQGPILVVAAVVGPFEVRRLIQLGAAGVFLKQNSPPTLIDTIRAVMSGEIRIDPAIHESSPDPDEYEGADQPLTDRQRIVLMGVFEGLSNKEIATRVHISEALVKSTIQQLFDKSGVRTRSQLVRIALEQYANQL